MSHPVYIYDIDVDCMQSDTMNELSLQLKWLKMKNVSVS